MEVLAAVIVASAAYVYAPILRLHAGRRLHVNLPANAVSPGSPEVVAPPVELPAGVVRWCEQESEEWARQEARDRARQLYAEHGDWNVVMQHLE